MSARGCRRTGFEPCRWIPDGSIPSGSSSKQAEEESHPPWSASLNGRDDLALFVAFCLAKREHKAAELLSINPAGKLPALVDGDARVFEGADRVRGGG